MTRSYRRSGKVYCEEHREQRQPDGSCLACELPNWRDEDFTSNDLLLQLTPLQQEVYQRVRIEALAKLRDRD